MFREKKLPLVFDNPIKALHYFIPAIILSEKDSSDWFFGNYIQIEREKDGYTNFSILDDDFIGVEPIVARQIDRASIIENELDIIEIVKREIDREVYIQLCLNEFYLPNKGAFSRRGFIHDNLVFGYDDDEIYLYGYDYKGQLSTIGVTYQEFQNSFYKGWDASSIGVGSIEYADKIYFVKKKKSEYTFDLTSIENQFEEYLEGKDYFERYREFRNIKTDKKSGIDVYASLLDELAADNMDVLLDTRNFCILRDHKAMMIQRTEYLKKKINLKYSRELEEAVKNLYTDSKIICAYAMKYILTQNIEIKNNVITKLKSLCENDYRFMEKYILALRISR